MTQVSLVCAERLPDGRVRLSTGNWSDLFEEARRAAWVRWYEKMAEDYPRGRYAEIASALKAPAGRAAEAPR